MTGVDAEEAAVCWARREAERLGLARLARFETHDCDLPLPFDDETFDVVICIDAVLNLADRAAALADWARVLRKGGSSSSLTPRSSRAQCQRATSIFVPLRGP